MSVFIAFLQKIGYSQQVSERLPVHLKSPNAIDPAQTYTAFLISVVAGARRFAHTSLLRFSLDGADELIDALPGCFAWLGARMRSVRHSESCADRV